MAGSDGVGCGLGLSMLAGWKDARLGHRGSVCATTIPQVVGRVQLTQP